VAATRVSDAWRSLSTARRIGVSFTDGCAVGDFAVTSG
jgi:hypothetical protein